MSVNETCVIAVPNHVDLCECLFEIVVTDKKKMKQGKNYKKIFVYCEYTLLGLGPGNKKKSILPDSEIQCDDLYGLSEVPSSVISMNVSLGLNQNTPAVFPFPLPIPCAKRSGICPYNAIT